MKTPKRWSCPRHPRPRSRPLTLAAALAAALAYALATPAARAQGDEPEPAPFALVNAELHPVSGPVIAKGTLVVDKGRIAAIGDAASVSVPAGVRVIDVGGARVVPGFVDAYTHLGLVEIALSQPTSDVHEGTGALQPHLRVLDALDLRGKTLARAVAGGVTTVHSVPASGNVIGGTTAVWRVVRNALFPAVALRAEAALHVSLTEAPLAYGRSQQPPMTRMGSVALLRESFVKAAWHADAVRRFEESHRKGTNDAKPPVRELRIEALLPAARREVPVVVRAERADDLLTAVRVAGELGLRLVLAGAAEGWRVAAALAAKKVPVIVAPVRAKPDRMERLGARLSNAALLAKAGVEVVIASGATHEVGNLAFEAGLARAHGLSPEAALRAITLAPARLLGVDKEVGSLEVGKRADLVVSKGDPMEPLSPLVAVYVGGVAVDLKPWEKSQ